MLSDPRTSQHPQLCWASGTDGTRPDPAPALPGDGAVSPPSAPCCSPGSSASAAAAFSLCLSPRDLCSKRRQSWVLAEWGCVGAEQGVLLLGDTSTSCKG